MNLNTAQWIAETLMREHGLTDWTFRWDNATRRAGICRHRERVIGLSRPCTQMDDEANVRDTILHEIAHALVGTGHGHDSVWKAKAREIGCTGERVSSTPAPKGRYRAVCPNHGEVGNRVRRPDMTGRKWWCQKCGVPIAWVDASLVRV